jgi:hypothetical protein
MRRVIACRASEDYTVWLMFDDGVTGLVHLKSLVDLESFRAIRPAEAFRGVRIDDQTGTLAWRGGVRLDPEILYHDIRSRWRRQR